MPTAYGRNDGHVRSGRAYVRWRGVPASEAPGRDSLGGRTSSLAPEDQRRHIQVCRPATPSRHSDQVHTLSRTPPAKPGLRRASKHFAFLSFCSLFCCFVREVVSYGGFFLFSEQASSVCRPPFCFFSHYKSKILILYKCNDTRAPLKNLGEMRKIVISNTCSSIQAML